MAIRKLTLSSFVAKYRTIKIAEKIAQTKSSPQYFHLIASLPRGRHRYALVCEFQPLLTVMSHGIPKRCPVCGLENADL
jgi:hypothetical protein